MKLKLQMKNLANTFKQDNLKSLRAYTHNEFDKLWKDGKFSRSEAYEWLANEMGLPPHKAHIGLFNKNQCQELLDILFEYRYGISKPEAYGIYSELYL